MSRILKTLLPFLIVYISYNLLSVTSTPLGMDDEGELHIDAKMKNIQPCQGAEHMKVRIENPAVKRTGRSSVGIFGDIVYDTKIEETDLWNIMILAFYQQPGSTSRLMVMDVPLENICNMLKDDENEQKDAYYNCIKGGLNRFCPIEPGTYSLSNYTYDQKDLKPFLRDGTYIFVFNQTVNMEMVGCTEIEMDVKVNSPLG